MEESKTCTKCQETKSTESFNRDKTRSDGRFPHCRACVKEYSAKYYQKNSAQIKAKVREYQAANSDKRIEISRRWRANNLEKNRQYQRDWMRQYRAENPLSHRRWQKNPEALKQWRADNPDKVILQNNGAESENLALSLIKYEQWKSRDFSNAHAFTVARSRIFKSITWCHLQKVAVTQLGIWHRLASHAMCARAQSF